MRECGGAPGGTPHGPGGEHGTGHRSALFVAMINRGRGYQHLRYLLLKAKRMAVTNIEFIAVRTVKRAA